MLLFSGAGPLLRGDYRSNVAESSNGKRYDLEKHVDEVLTFTIKDII